MSAGSNFDSISISGDLTFSSALFCEIGKHDQNLTKQPEKSGVKTMKF